MGNYLSGKVAPHRCKEGIFIYSDVSVFQLPEIIIKGIFILSIPYRKNFINFPIFAFALRFLFRKNPGLSKRKIHGFFFSEEVLKA